MSTSYLVSVIQQQELIVRIMADSGQQALERVGKHEGACESTLPPQLVQKSLKVIRCCDE